MKKAVALTFAIGLVSNFAFAGGAGTGQPITEIVCPATANHARYDIRFSESSGWWYTTGKHFVLASDWVVPNFLFEDGSTYVAKSVGKNAPGVLTVHGQEIECFQVWETF